MVNFRNQFQTNVPLIIWQGLYITNILQFIGPFMTVMDMWYIHFNTANAQGILYITNI